MKINKRILSILLTLVVILTTLPIMSQTAMAEDVRAFLEFHHAEEYSNYNKVVTTHFVGDKLYEFPVASTVEVDNREVVVFWHLDNPKNERVVFPFTIEKSLYEFYATYASEMTAYAEPGGKVSWNGEDYSTSVGHDSEDGSDLLKTLGINQTFYAKADVGYRFVKWQSQLKPHSQEQELPREEMGNNPTLVVKSRGREYFYAIFERVPITVSVPVTEAETPIEPIDFAQYMEGGTAPYTFSKKSGPDWLAVSQEGRISGKPSAIQTNEALVICVEDAEAKKIDVSIPVGETKTSYAITYSLNGQVRSALCNTLTDKDCIPSGVENINVNAGGKIESGSYQAPVYVWSQGEISGGKFLNEVTVEAGGLISGGEFEGYVSNAGKIQGGIFKDGVINVKRGTDAPEIDGGNFAGQVYNYGGAIIKSGVFAKIENSGDINVSADKTLVITDDFNNYSASDIMVNGILKLPDNADISALVGILNGNGAVKIGDDVFDTSGAEHAHALVLFNNSQKATCMEFGVKEYYKCSKCNKYFEDEATTKEITDIEAWKNGDGRINALGHKYGQPTFAWTSYASAKAIFTCENDATHKEVKDVAITNKVTKDATTTAEGIKTYTATVVFEGRTYTDTKDEIIPKLKDDSKQDTDKPEAQVKVLDPDKKEVSYVAPKNKKLTTITIPGSVVVNGVTYKVTKINDGAFKGNKTVTKIVLPSSIKIIGKDAFNGCSKLKTITIPKNVTEIGANAFKGCTSITKITLPSKVAKIGANAFNGCKKLKTLTIKTTKLTDKKVGSKAFKGIGAKAKVKVPKSKLKAYKKILKKKGISGKKQKITK